MDSAAVAAAAATAAANSAVAASRWFLNDRIASLREAFRRTPKWLGFNIELKCGRKGAGSLQYAAGFLGWTSGLLDHGSAPLTFLLTCLDGPACGWLLLPCDCRRGTTAHAALCCLQVPHSDGGGSHARTVLQPQHLCGRGAAGEGSRGGPSLLQPLLRVHAELPTSPATVPAFYSKWQGSHGDLFSSARRPLGLTVLSGPLRTPQFPLHPIAHTQVVLEEGAGRRVIFSTFDPDCATLLSLKQPRYPVLFLTCGGTKLFADPRMNSLEAALQFALASRLQVGTAARWLGQWMAPLLAARW